MQHYTQDTKAVLLFCPTCNRKTMHQVNDHRVGSCLEPHVTGMSRAQAKRAVALRKAVELLKKQEELDL